MKELTIEEKTKAYDEAKARMCIAFNSNRCTIGFMNEIFPELKESEDERIRKEMISRLKGFIGEANGVGYTEGEIRERIDWLEKQSEKEEPQVYETENGEVITYSETDGYKVVEPKFKVGDWIVYNRNDSSREILYVYDIRDGRYYFNDNVHFSWSIKECDGKSHLWTIADAKDGDVLAVTTYTEGTLIGIFKKQNSCTFSSHCFVNAEGIFKQGTYYHGNGTAIYPATKEQRDILFQKMKEADYEWDAEKKELNEIEQKSTWSEEDEEFLSEIISDIKLAQDKYSDSQMNQIIFDEEVTWLKSLKERVLPQSKQDWSEEDEYTLGETIQHLEELIRIEKVKYCGIDVQYYQRDIDWLKSLKDRVQPQPKQWSEEDEAHFDSISKRCTPGITYTSTKYSISEDINWLKSLKGRYIWKPSEEQIEILNMVLTNESMDDNVARILRELREQLKKLK